MPPCPRCAGADIKQDGKVGATQRYRCHTCHRTFIARTGTPFAGHRWPQEVIVTAVRWYLRYRLSAADVRDLLAERGVDVSARTVLYWVQKFAPLAGPRGAAGRHSTRRALVVRRDVCARGRDVGVPLPRDRCAWAGGGPAAAHASGPG